MFTKHPLPTRLGLAGLLLLGACASSNRSSEAPEPAKTPEPPSETEAETADLPTTQGQGVVLAAPPEAPDGKAGPIDELFFSKALTGGMLVVEAAKRARARGLPELHDDLAQTLLRTHQAANQRLRDLARSSDTYTLPDGQPETNAKLLDSLAAASPAGAERLHHELQVAAHEKLVALYRRCQVACDDDRLESYAADLLPALEAHREDLVSLPIPDPVR